MGVLFLLCCVFAVAPLQLAAGAAPPPPPPLPLRPYPWITGGPGTALPGADLSPDPLVAWQWPAGTNSTQMQLYNVTATAITAQPEGAFVGLDSLLGKTAGGMATVLGPGSLTIDFGTESASWLEIDSPDMPPDVLKTLTLSISETNVAYCFASNGDGRRCKTATPVKHGNTYRLEVAGNWEVYEGVRFGFLTAGNASASGTPWHITAIRVVAQTLPVPYAAGFSAPDDALLTRSWWVGAYCPKLNMGSLPLPGSLPPSELMLNAILVWRGDRIGWTGDDHVAQKTIMTVFGQHEFVRQNLWNTHNDSNNIESYAVLWTMSVADYYMETNDTDTLQLYAANIDAKLKHAQSIEGSASGWGKLKPWHGANLRFFGWDERLGAGFENASCPESQRDYSMLTSRASREFADALQRAGLRPDWVTAHRQAADQILANLRKDPTWWQDFGMHAAAEAINTNQLTAAEVARLVPQLEDVTQICSLSPFNQFWILQALGNAGLMAKAQESIDLCWGGQVRLGGTAFWEIFQDDWNSVLEPSEPVFDSDNGMTSLCHPWSSGLVQWTTENLGGIAPLLPNFGRFRVAPALARVSLQRPVFRTAPIEVEVDAPSGRHSLRVPPRTQAAEVLLPLSPEANATLGASWALDEAESGRQHTAHVVPGVGKVHWALQLDAPLEPGTYSFHSPRLLRGARPAKTAAASTQHGARRSAMLQDTGFGPAVWPARLVGEDRRTQGNWRGVYGGDGYVIFGESAPTPFPGPACDLSGTWHSETPNDVIVVSQSKGSNTFKTTLNGEPWDSGVIRANGTIAFEQHIGVVSNTNGSAYGCDYIRWDWPQTTLYWCRSGASCGASGNHKLPAFVHNVVPGSSGQAFTGPFDSDPRALAMPSGTGRTLANGIGPVSSGAAPAHEHLDIQLNTADEGKQNYTVSLYFCDWDAPGTPTANSFLHQARKDGLLVFDLATRRKVMPVVLLSDYEQGLWVRFTYDRSVRLRFMNVLGDGPTLSGIMFDVESAGVE